MKKITLQNLPARSVTYFLLCALVVAAVVLLAVLPAYRYIGELDKRIDRTGQRIEAEKRLLPLYQELLKRSQLEVKRNLPLPDRTFIPRRDVDMMPSIFAGIGVKSGMEVISANPDVMTLATGQTRVLVNAAIRGNFFNYRKFLVELGRLPYIDRIEEIQIQQKSPEKEYRMKIWLNVS